MRHGTQEELDAAKDDATKLPFGALFKSKKLEHISDHTLTDGVILKRGNEVAKWDDEDSVGFSLEDESDYWYVSAEELEVIK